ncbi:YdcF family protein [Bacillus sp. DX1.1]|uniref:YdcF family protein n=1 Tax=unclassified Bacillus (in: firmicutes) TaxID=185979 RepID=UPI002570330F|nr:MULTISPECIES: YdcF family protein [unclassified Bacillus (in: firmicutes)]MDM5154243.1 YdcF family protein [Bacillus sp. DX1.1]WJE84027.1 YdcF family protein [Bacillus sp. DX3.1]
MKRKKLIKYIFILFMIVVSYMGALQYTIYKHGHMEAPNDAEYMILLGARVKGNEPSLSLQYRIDKAAEYLKKHQQTTVIVSGGKGKGENISEASAMKRELMEQEIEEERIIMEDRSTSTDENIKFSKSLIPSNKQKGIIVTNDFHMYRAKKIAEKQGLQLDGLSAKTPKMIAIKSNVREYLAITKYWLMNQI